MAQKEHLFFKMITLLKYYCVVMSLLLAVSCTTKQQPVETKQVVVDLVAAAPDTSGIPHDTLSYRDKGLSFINNHYLRNGKPYSGIIKAIYSNKKTRYYMSVYQGMQHGLYKSYYPDGKVFEVRQYKNNLSNGRHFGYWDNGVLKFDFNYVDDKREGYIKQWFATGQPYIFAHYLHDQEEGLQRGWRPNGKLFLNYVAKDGHTYGLQETMLCYTLRDQKIPKL